jgi:hypothetical protein
LAVEKRFNPGATTVRPPQAAAAPHSEASMIGQKIGQIGWTFTASFL